MAFMPALRPTREKGPRSGPPAVLRRVVVVDSPGALRADWLPEVVELALNSCKLIAKRLETIVPKRINFEIRKRAGKKEKSTLY